MAPPKRKSSDDNDDVVFVSSQPRSKVARQYRPYADPNPRNAHSRQDREAWSSQPSSNTARSSQPSSSTTRSSQPSSSAATPARPYYQGYVYSQPDRNNPVIIDDEEEAVGQEILDLTQDSFDDATYSGYELYGILGTKIVGCQYYSGHATTGEYVSIRREPSNPYDSNAIRVDNVMRNQIGHIPRKVALKLANYMDSKSLLVEGVLTGSIGQFDCPIALKLFGSSDPVARAELRSRMKADRLPTDDVNRREQEAKKKKTEELKELKARKAAEIKGSKLGYTNSAHGGGEQSGPNMDEILKESERFNPREMGEVVEKYGSGEEQLKALPMADQPSQVATKLLPYQQQGLAWMLNRENPKVPERGSKEVVQLWKRDGPRFKNVATNFAQNDEPRLASGGILADDMGLGKTLQVISLIMADRDTEPNAKTLILAPVSVMSNWSGQIERHVKEEHRLRVLTYHGAGKKQVTSKGFDQCDVVITTYGSLSADYFNGREDPSPVPRKNGLYSVKWRRVVLDEGHIIRNPKTKNAAAVCGLIARSRWILTGTPIVNNLKDLYSYVKFLNVSGGLEQLEVFNSQLIRPLNAGDETASLLLQAIMSCLCLRRKKDMAFVNLRLPELTEYVHRVTFLDHEREKYEAFQKQAKGMLASWAKHSDRGSSKAGEEYRNLLEVLLRLRQVCNHWKLCGDRVTSLMKLLETEKLVDLTPENRRALQDMLQLSMEAQDDCAICLEPLHHPVITACGHVFGGECIERTIDLQHKCPMCRAELKDTESLVQPGANLGEAQEDQNIGVETSSSKIDAMMSILKASHRKAGTKVVIFSQWTSFLNIVEHQLDENGFKYTRIDGKMNASRRDAAMHTFEKDPDCTILLASLAVCSVGLNLVAANQVILCDSWWAPAIEDQAVDRVHRLGQTRPTTVWRLVVEDSIEDRVLEIQAEKRKLMMTAFQDKTTKRGKQKAARRNDIERLLN